MGHTQILQAVGVVGTVPWIIVVEKEMYLILEDITLEVWQLIESNGFIFVKLNTPTYTEGTPDPHIEFMMHMV